MMDGMEWGGKSHQRTRAGQPAASGFTRLAAPVAAGRLQFDEAALRSGASRPQRVLAYTTLSELDELLTRTRTACGADPRLGTEGNRFIARPRVTGARAPNIAGDALGTGAFGAIDGSECASPRSAREVAPEIVRHR